MELLLSNGNPFEESSKDLVTLDNKVCESAAAAASVLKVESMGQEQYNNFKKNVLDSHDTPLTAQIKRNNLMLFHEKKTRKKTAAKLRMQHFKRHAELYGKAFIVLESRSGNLEDFFCHESSPYPPALSCEGSLNSCTKSDLLFYILGNPKSGGISDSEETVAPDLYDFIVIVGGALIHSLPGTTVQGKTFESYFDKVLLESYDEEKDIITRKENAKASATRRTKAWQRIADRVEVASPKEDSARERDERHHEREESVCESEERVGESEERVDESEEGVDERNHEREESSEQEVFFLMSHDVKTADCIQQGVPSSCRFKKDDLKPV
ncbi:unnamed protein product [Boreogadus saida]